MPASLMPASFHVCTRVSVSVRMNLCLYACVCVCTRVLCLYARLCLHACVCVCTRVYVHLRLPERFGQFAPKLCNCSLRHLQLSMVQGQ